MLERDEEPPETAMLAEGGIECGTVKQFSNWSPLLRELKAAIESDRQFRPALRNHL